MEEQTATQATPRKWRFPVKSVLILAAITLLEGGVFTVWMTFARPATAGGSDTAHVPAEKVKETAEIKMMEFQAFNRKTGRTFRYDVSIAVECDKEKKPIVLARCEERRNLLQDQFRTLIAKAEPQHLQEPDLETLRRQVKAALDEILGEGMIDKVLIPSCSAYPVEY